MATISPIILNQLDTLINEYEQITTRSKYDDLSDLEASLVNSFITSAVASVHRISGKDSVYSTELNTNLAKLPLGYAGSRTKYAAGVLLALRADVKNGYLDSVQQLIHANVFSDFLEMAEYLYKDGYKDPAAVLAGGVLEEHLRKLAQKNGLAIEYADSSGVLRPIKADRLNNDLKASNVYSALEHKNIVAWLELRNKAAHGKYVEYDAAHVDLLLRGIRDFLVRYPA